VNAQKPILELQNVRFVYKQRRSFLGRSEFQAIRDVSFTVERGETVGIIGRNGSGKSTLLRIIAGIFRPDGGKIIQHCEKVSLLSLSLGFDPELSGRDNAVISGMLSGSSRKEVTAELAEIVEFAELGEFIDEPIKTYSTGMRARLGFSVALKLQTDLMLLDEVLSVGDIHFRQKAEKAMIDRISSDQSVILVSHSLDQAQRLCDRLIWLEQGVVYDSGEPAILVEKYQRAMKLNELEAKNPNG
jgi:lipopolysaccharide transport system ATP-binding protein